MYLFLAVLDLHCCTGFSLVAGSEGYSLAVVRRILIVVAFPVAAWSLRAYGLSSCGERA